MDEKRVLPPYYATGEQPPADDMSLIKRKQLDIPDANLSPFQKLDIYLPDESNGPIPVNVIIHRGIFMDCFKAGRQVY